MVRRAAWATAMGPDDVEASDDEGRLPPMAGVAVEGVGESWARRVALDVSPVDAFVIRGFRGSEKRVEASECHGALERGGEPGCRISGDGSAPMGGAEGPRGEQASLPRCDASLPLL